MLNSIPKEEFDIHYNHHPYIIKEKNGVMTPVCVVAPFLVAYYMFVSLLSVKFNLLF